MTKLFTDAHAPLTLDPFLRQFSFGHVRKLNAVASRFLANLTVQALMFVPDDD